MLFFFPDISQEKIVTLCLTLDLGLGGFFHTVLESLRFGYEL